MTIKYHKSTDGEYRICVAQKNCYLQEQNEHVTLAVLTQKAQSGVAGYDAFKDVSDQLDDYDEVHYRVYLPEGASEPKSVCVQSFDYFQYDGSRFLDKVAYKKEKAAQVKAEEFNEQNAPKWMRQPVSKAIQAYRDNLVEEGEVTPLQDVLSQLENYDDVHYRVYLSTRTNTPVTVCVQDFDYYDYEGERFLEKKAYSTEEEAQNALADWV